MTSIEEICEWHPRSLQKWLSEIDEDDLILVMPHLPQSVSHLIMENLSSRMRKMVSDSMKTDSEIPEKIIERAQERIIEIANELIEIGELNEPGEEDLVNDYPRKTLLPSKLEIDTTKELINTLITLGKYAQERGVLSLEEALGKVEEPFFKEALQLIIDGTDSDLVDEILRNKIDAIIYHKELLYNLMIEGLLGIQAGNSSWTLEMRLRSHLPPEMGDKLSQEEDE